MKLWSIVVILAGLLAIPVTSIQADESHPTNSSGDFKDQEDAMKPAGISFFQGSSNCGIGNDFEAWSEWYDFEQLPFTVSTGRFRYLYVKWQEHHVANKAVVSTLIEYSRDGGSSWRTLVANTYSSGIATSSWTETVTVLPIIFPSSHGPFDLSQLVVRAGITIDECCTGEIGPYGGGLYIKEIKVTTERP